MSESPLPPSSSPPVPAPGARPGADQDLLARIRAHQRREAEAAAHSGRSLWRTVAHVGALGWLLALPTVAGAYLGHQLDRRLEAGVTWALCGLGLGLCAGGYLIWRAVAREEQP